MLILIHAEKASWYKNQKRSIAMKNKKTKKIKNINKKTLIVTMDIGKTFHYGYFRAPNGADIKPFPFYNTKKSFNGFWDKICQFKAEQNLGEIVVGFESTGAYAEPLFHFLRKKPVKMVQVNPAHTKKVKELEGNSPNKTDKKDPRVIADIISLGHALTVVVPEGAAAQLRRLSQARERALKSRTANINQLQDLIFVVFPEFLQVMKDTKTKSARYLIKNHLTPESIVALGVETLTVTLKKLSHGQLGQDRAEELFKVARESVGINEGRESILLEMKHLVSNVENADRFIGELEDQMNHHLTQIPYSHSILSIKGIGNVTVAGLIGEVGDFKKFDTIREVMKLAGLDLYEISSGQHNGRHRISKRGRSLMRKLLFFGAINVVKRGGIMHEVYNQMIERGMEKMKALIAISRKLLRVIFALARNNTEYVENYINIHGHPLAA
jgi:transposase